MPAAPSHWLTGLLALVTAGGSAVALAAPASATTVPAVELADRLVVTAETTSPSYDRDLFEHWVDADQDGCNTRREVLIAESTTPARVTGGCSVSGT